MEHKGILYTGHDLMKLLQLKNIDTSTVLHVYYYKHHRPVNYNNSKDYEFTIIFNTFDKISSESVNINVKDLLFFNRDKYLKELLYD